MENSEPKSGLVRRLGMLDASSIVIGSMIGSGIFIAPSLMAGFIQTPGLLITALAHRRRTDRFRRLEPGRTGRRLPPGRRAVRIFKGGLFAAVGLPLRLDLLSWWCRAVLSPLWPLPSPNTWVCFSLFWVKPTNCFRSEFSVKPVSLSTAQVAAILCIMLLTAVNIRGVRAGAALQNMFTIAKVAAMLLLVGAAFIFFRGEPEEFYPFAQAGPARSRCACLCSPPWP